MVYGAQYVLRVITNGSKSLEIKTQVVDPATVSFNSLTPLNQVLSQVIQTKIYETDFVTSRKQLKDFKTNEDLT